MMRLDAAIERATQAVAKADLADWTPAGNACAEARADLKCDGHLTERPRDPVGVAP